MFFFKQKTAYEMRISDWSSDVCSSDLIRQGLGRLVGAHASPPVRDAVDLVVQDAIGDAFLLLCDQADSFFIMSIDSSRRFIDEAPAVPVDQYSVGVDHDKRFRRT